MARGYFSYFPKLKYVSRSTDRSSNDEYIEVINLFRRPRLRKDFESVFTAFADYVIGEDIRPEQVAQELYNDPRFDWIILIANNITNLHEEWPLDNHSFRKFLLEKYGSDEQLGQVHHYETTLFTDDFKRVVMPAGLRVDSNFNITYLELNKNRQESVSQVPTLDQAARVDANGTVYNSAGTKIVNDKLAAITNFEYEVQINDAKRRIKVPRPEFVDTMVTDMRNIMRYRKSSAYISDNLKDTFNPRLSGQ